MNREWMEMNHKPKNHERNPNVKRFTVWQIIKKSRSWSVDVVSDHIFIKIIKKKSFVKLLIICYLLFLINLKVSCVKCKCLLKTFAKKRNNFVQKKPHPFFFTSICEFYGVVNWFLCIFSRTPVKISRFPQEMLKISQISLKIPTKPDFMRNSIGGKEKSVCVDCPRAKERVRKV